MRPIEAVSFDYDGTLVDTSLAMKKAASILAKHISSLTNVDYNEFYKHFIKASESLSKIGNYSRYLWIVEALKPFNISVRSYEIVKLVKEYWNYVTENTHVFADTLEVIAWLRKRNYKIALLTNTDGSYGIKRKRIEKTFPKNLFDTIIVAGDDSEKPKPHIEAFYTLAKTLNVEPEKIVHVGDDYISDVMGSSRAGMLPVLINRENRSSKVYKNIIIISNLKELLKYL